MSTPADLVASICANETRCQATVETVCLGMLNGEMFYQLTDELNNKAWFQIYGLVSALFNLWFASLIWRHKELQVHPMKLLMWIAIIDALYFSNQFFTTYCCYFWIPEQIVWFTTW
jgi:hypothetical protein